MGKKKSGSSSNRKASRSNKKTHSSGGYEQLEDHHHDQDDEKLPTTKTTRKQHDKKGRKRKNRFFGNSVDDRNLRKRITAANKHYEIVHMADDGNCLFRSLSDQLYRDSGDRHGEIRKDVCDFLSQNEEDFAPFMVFDDEDEDATDFESYISTMRDDGEWGGNIELMAAARLYRRDIRVFSTEEYKIEHSQGDQATGPELLVSYHNNDHYNSVRDTSLDKIPIPVKAFTTSDAKKSESNPSTSVKDGSDPASTDKPKRSGPCPCGSGKKYQKCCHKKKMHARRMQGNPSNNSQVTSDDDEEIQEMTSDFTVLKIDNKE